MYDVTIEYPGIDDRQFTCATGGELRNLVWGVARAQGQPITSEAERDREMIHEVGALRSRADIEGVGTLAVVDCTVRVEPADEIPYRCEGHQGEDVFLLGGPEFCDGTCRPARRRFDHEALVDLSMALDDAELEESGGCGACGLEADAKCEGCGLCNCETHGACVRPAGGPDTGR